MKHKHKSKRQKQDYKDPVRAKKFLGQHFLKDESVAEKISETLDIEQSTSVLEIGPGTGVLTKYLLQLPVQLTLIELDRDSIAYLKDGFFTEYPMLNREGFNLIEADFLKYDIVQLFGGEQFSIIGNFPYNISSQILFKTIENRQRIPQFSGMFQKEVAQRICEKPGSKIYGILSVLTQAFYKAEYLFTVPPNVFSPPPKVNSGVLKLTRKQDFSLDCDEKLFFRVVKTGFQQRRKTLRNSLRSLSLPEDAKTKSIFRERPEQLSVEDFVELTNLIQANHTKS